MASDKKYKQKEVVPLEPPPVPEKDYTFFNERLLPIGWTAERNVVTLPAEQSGQGKETQYPLFEADEAGNILINYYRITGHKAEYRTDGAKWSKHYQLKRLRMPTYDKNGDEVKYIIPRGAGTFAWFPPEVLQAYREKRQIDTLVMTEGALKAFCAAGFGAMVVGLTSISHYKDKSAGTLHPDVLELIKVCRPKEVIWLVDGDCHQLSAKWPDEKPDQDLYRRPNLFYSSAKNIGILLKEPSKTYGFNSWFMHVNSGAFTMPEGGTPPKGLDDLLMSYPVAKSWQEVHKPGQVIRKPGMTDVEYTEAVLEQEKKLAADRAEWAQRNAEALAKEVVEDLVNVSKTPRFFERKDLDRPTLLREYFHLRSAQDFYSHYQELIGTREFVYDGTKYQWTEGESGGQGELKVKVPSVAKHYMRVGTEYFKRIKVPNKFGDLEEKLVNWKKPTIIDDHGKHFTDHVLKLEAFCNVPDHMNYQEIVKSCLNTYSRFEHEPDEHADPPESTLKFLAHIFGHGEVVCDHPKKKNDDGTPAQLRIKEVDLGLDYLQLLYQRPTQMLPIVCLVSKERGTGKTTFFKYLKQLFTGNCVFVGGKDFESDFNEHYASRKVIILDEALVDKQLVVEKMKALSTGDKIMVNAKGRPQYEQDFFGCFVMGSNNVESFIRTDDDETRFWVREVKPIPNEDLDTELEQKLYREIPAMLHLLGTRTMSTAKLYRSWFTPELLFTDVLRRVREYSQPGAVKSIRNYMRDLFMATKEEVLYMTSGNVQDAVFPGGGKHNDRTFTRKIMRDVLHLKKHDHGQTVTYSYPVLVKDHGTQEKDIRWVKSKLALRPYIIPRSVFWPNDAEWNLIKESAGEVGGEMMKRAQTAVVGGNGETKDEDLPF